jgi:hypothetical protein
MSKYYYDFMSDSEDWNDIAVITEEQFKQAEQGKNYLNAENFCELGEYETINQARKAMESVKSEEDYCKQNDC